MARLKFECIHADTCLPDYWRGHHEPHISIPVYRNMSLKAIKQALHNEISQGAIAGSIPKEIAYNEYELTERGYAKFHAAINRIKPSVKGTRVFFKDLEPSNDEGDYDDYSVYAYFVLREID